MNIITDSLSYAFRSSGKYMLVVGAVLSVISSIASIAPVFGLFAYIFLSSYFCATYFSIIESTAVGDTEAPDFPDVSNVLEDLVWPMFKVLLIGCFSYAPYIFYVLFVERGENIVSDILFVGGSIYFPMAVLAVVVLGYLGAFSPHIVIPSIVRSGWMYWVAVALLYVIYTLQGVVSELFEGHIIVGTLVMGFLGMYVLMTSARILGIVYKSRAEQLGWI